MKQKVALACDHRGFEIKNEIIAILKHDGCEVIDCGAFSAASTDYPDYIFDAATGLSRGDCDRAIGICYTGIGSTIAANKVKGVRAALVHTVKEAELSRAHNDSNMLILGSGFMDHKILPDVVKTWLHTNFEGGRHEQRVNKIKSYEATHG